MKTLLLMISCMVLCSCKVSKPEIDTAERLCKDHKGLYSLDVKAGLYATCNDGFCIIIPNGGYIK